MNNDIEQQRAHFNSIAEKYFSARNHPNHLLLKNLIWKSFFDRHPDLQRTVRSVMEPMCGMAEGFEILKKNTNSTFSYFGFDYSEAMVEIARKDKPALRVEWGNVTTFKSPIEPVDLIILIGGLHHVYSKTQEAIENLTHSLKPGGYFLNFEPTHNNWIARRARKNIYKKNDLFDNDTEQGFERDQLLDHFRKAGYGLVDEVSPGLASYIMYYNPDAFPFLNIGGPSLVKALFTIDKLFWTNWIGKKMSFATITLWKAAS